MPYVPLAGPQLGPSTQQVRSKAGPVLPLLPTVLVLVYLSYLVVFIIAPYFIGAFGDAIDGPFPALYRLLLAVFLMVFFGALMLYDLMKGQDRSRPGNGQMQVQRASPLGGGPMQGGGQPKFAPVTVQSAAAPPPTQTPARTRDIERTSPAPRIFTYPQEVEGGIYGDTYIQLSPSKIVRIRSLMVDQRYMS